MNAKVQNIFILSICVFISACAISKPCQDGGDITIPGIVIQGDVRCKQKEIDGRWKNHGSFVHNHLNGNIGIEGEFVEGRKEGIWLIYSDDGALKTIKYYEKDIDRPPSLLVQKQIDIIIQKAETQWNADEKNGKHRKASALVKPKEEKK
jgi:antitoxin component YwqK of YwqJK toxin-antitoxin module